MERFAKTLRAGWSDIDFNLRMRNTAYLDKAVDVRMMFFAETGFPIAEFLKRGIGPVMKSDTIDFFREVRLHEEFQVTMEASGWLDLKARKPVASPADLHAVMQKMSRTAEFEPLP